MSNGQYSIAITQLPIGPVSHIVIVEFDDQGNKIGEIDGGPANRSGTGVASVDNDPGAYIPGARTVYAQTASGSQNIYYYNGLAKDLTTVLQGNQTAIEDAWQAGVNAANDINNLNLPYQLYT